MNLIEYFLVFSTLLIAIAYLGYHFFLAKSACDKCPINLKVNAVRKARHGAMPNRVLKVHQQNVPSLSLDTHII